VNSLAGRLDDLVQGVQVFLDTPFKISFTSWTVVQGVQGVQIFCGRPVQDIVHKLDDRSRDPNSYGRPVHDFLHKLDGQLERPQNRSRRDASEKQLERLDGI
jgi:hypothetical protein